MTKRRATPADSPEERLRQMFIDEWNEIRYEIEDDLYGEDDTGEDTNVEDSYAR